MLLSWGDVFQLYFTLGCKPSSVSSPPAEPRRPRCRHNVGRSPAFPVGSGICLTKQSFQTEPKAFAASVTCPRFVHVSSGHAAKLLLKDGEDVPHRGGERLRIQHPNGTAALPRRDLGQRFLRESDDSTIFCTGNIHTFNIHTFNTNKSSFHQRSHLVEVPHGERQSSTWRIVCLPLPVNVAGHVQVYSKLNIFLWEKQKPPWFSAFNSLDFTSFILRRSKPLELDHS